MSQVEWYYARDNRQMGPVSSAELKRLATFDELRPDDLVWREGMTEWAAARNVRGLFEEEVAPAAAAGGVANRLRRPVSAGQAARPRPRGRAASVRRGDGEVPPPLQRRISSRRLRAFFGRAAPTACSLAAVLSASVRGDR